MKNKREGKMMGKRAIVLGVFLQHFESIISERNLELSKFSPGQQVQLLMELRDLTAKHCIEKLGMNRNTFLTCFQPIKRVFLAGCTWEDAKTHTDSSLMEAIKNGTVEVK